MILQVEIQDLRMMLKEKCEEIITDKKLAYELYWRICDIEEDPRFVDVTDTVEHNEPAEAIEITNNFYPIGDPLRTVGWKCGHCNEKISGDANYCPNCGREIKWDD